MEEKRPRGRPRLILTEAETKRRASKKKTQLAAAQKKFRESHTQVSVYLDHELSAWLDEERAERSPARARATMMWISSQSSHRAQSDRLR